MKAYVDFNLFKYFAGLCKVIIGLIPRDKLYRDIMSRDKLYRDILSRDKEYMFRNSTVSRSQRGYSPVSLSHTFLRRAKKFRDQKMGGLRGQYCKKLCNTGIFP